MGLREHHRFAPDPPGARQKFAPRAAADGANSGRKSASAHRLNRVVSDGARNIAINGIRLIYPPVAYDVYSHLCDIAILACGRISGGRRNYQLRIAWRKGRYDILQIATDLRAPQKSENKVNPIKLAHRRYIARIFSFRGSTPTAATAPPGTRPNLSERDEITPPR